MEEKGKIGGAILKDCAHVLAERKRRKRGGSGLEGLERRKAKRTRSPIGTKSIKKRRRGTPGICSKKKEGKSLEKKEETGAVAAKLSTSK